MQHQRSRFGIAAATCTIALATKGNAMVGAGFIRDTTVAGGETSTDPYFQKPVVWRP